MQQLASEQYFQCLIFKVVSEEIRIVLEDQHCISFPHYLASSFSLIITEYIPLTIQILLVGENYLANRVTEETNCKVHWIWKEVKKRDKIWRKKNNFYVLFDRLSNRYLGVNLDNTMKLCIARRSKILIGANHLGQNWKVHKFNHLVIWDRVDPLSSSENPRSSPTQFVLHETEIEEMDEAFRIHSGSFLVSFGILVYVILGFVSDDVLENNDECVAKLEVSNCRWTFQI